MAEDCNFENEEVKQLGTLPFQLAGLVSAISLFAIAAAIFIVNENDDNEGWPRDDMKEACWLKQTL